MRVTGIVVVVVLSAASLLPATAQASSLVFNRPDGNVWLANPDGTGLYQVTLDGSAGNPYGAPSQADDGTIVTTLGTGDQRADHPHEAERRGAERVRAGGGVQRSACSTPTVSRDGIKGRLLDGYLGDSELRMPVSPGRPGRQFCFSDRRSPRPRARRTPA